ncbi:hypothetical protein DRQ50_05110 [bacterium]|nr:MAG: hypothetical protein DRQ50_05110 [bacterium]
MNASIVLAMISLRLRRVFSDRMALVWFLAMPLVFSFLMGQLLGDWSDSGDGAKPRFLVLAPVQDNDLERLLLPLRDHERFQIEMRDTLIADAVVQKAVADNRVTAVLIVPGALATSDSTTGGPRLYYNADRLSSQTVRTLLDRHLLGLNTELAARSLVAPPDAAGHMPRGRARAFDVARFDSLLNEPRVILAAETLGRQDKEQAFALTDSFQHVGPSYTLFFVMMFVLLSAKDLVTERQDRTLARLTASRATAGTLVAGFFGGALVLGLIQIAVLLVLNGIMGSIDYGDSPATLVAVVVLFAGVCAAGSVLMGSLARTGSQADGIGVAVTMMMAALGGLWWPLEIVPEFMQELGRALPSGQAITIFHDMIGRGWGLAECGGLLIGLAFWFVALLVLAVWRLRRLVTV